MDTQVPARWRTNNRPSGFVDGPDEAMWHAHTEAGKPADITTFRAGYTRGARDGERKSPLVADLAAALKKANQLNYFQRMQMSTQQRAAADRVAHAAGLIESDEERDAANHALLTRAGVKP